MTTPQNCAIIVLAAGASRRLGQPKQLLPLGSTTLLGHTISVALQSGCQPVVVVAGAHEEAVKKILEKPGITVLQNAGWHEGMASSVRMGLQFLTTHYPQVLRVVLMVCDQPFVNKKHLLCLADTHQSTGKGIVASSYGGKMGTPALFSNSYFDELLKLTGDTGARNLLIRFKTDVATVNFAEGDIDIDTPEDYKKILEQWSEGHDS